MAPGAAHADRHDFWRTVYAHPVGLRLAPHPSIPFNHPCQAGGQHMVYGAHPHTDAPGNVFSIGPQESFVPSVAQESKISRPELAQEFRGHITWVPGVPVDRSLRRDSRSPRVVAVWPGWYDHLKR